MTVDGIEYLAGVTSFYTATTADGNPNSDYGDVWGAARVTRDQVWIDANANVAYFWNATSGGWNTGTSWDSEAVPDAMRTAVVSNGVATIGAAATAEYTFVDWNGRLEMNAGLTTNDLLLKRTGVLAVGPDSKRKALS